METLIDDPTEPVPEPTPPSPRAAFAFPFLFFGLLGLIALCGAFVVSWTDGGSRVATAEAAAAVSLSELTITPKTVNGTTTGGLDVTNKGTMQHNLAVEGTTLATRMLGAGAVEHLDLSSLAPGDYTIVCVVPGHKEAGMSGALHVVAGSRPSAAAGATPATPGMDMSASAMTPEQMDAAMHDSMAAFPAKTDGLGAQVLAPTVLADGTKQFELTTTVTSWEVSPGKVVQAMTYNGTVPGPTIKVDPGDHVRVVLHNRMPESTSVHFHGLITPNAMDGVTEITQPPVKSGEDFTYEWTVQSTPAVGMYHSHHDAVRQVPDGLAGAFIVGQEPVPADATVSQEQVMVLDDSGVIGFALNGKSFPATAPIVAPQGDWIEVHYMNEGNQIHPMHLHGMAQLVIAKDGYPLATPQQEDTVTVAPGERYTVLVHATEPGTWVWHCHILTHAENDQGMFGMVTALVVK
ncbi:MAG: multicopper oxidase domain-containing protein [Acidimicrobiales bacterium]